MGNLREFPRTMKLAATGRFLLLPLLLTLLLLPAGARAQGELFDLLTPLYNEVIARLNALPPATNAPLRRQEATLNRVLDRLDSLSTNAAPAYGSQLRQLAYLERSLAPYYPGDAGLEIAFQSLKESYGTALYDTYVSYSAWANAHLDAGLGNANYVRSAIRLLEEARRRINLSDLAPSFAAGARQLGLANDFLLNGYKRLGVAPVSLAGLAFDLPAPNVPFATGAFAGVTAAQFTFGTNGTYVWQDNKGSSQGTLRSLAKTGPNALRIELDDSARGRVTSYYFDYLGPRNGRLGLRAGNGLLRGFFNEF